MVASSPRLPASTADEAFSKRLEQLLKEADGASRHVNTVHLSFLLFAAYVLVTIASTTHEQLLRIAPVSLPVLNVNVPILGFYLVVPWLVLLFHFNLLLQLYFLSRKLFALDMRLASLTDESATEHRILLFAFPFTNLLVGRHSRLVHGVLTLMVAVTFVVMPLTLLVGAQVAFLPFHSVTVTACQRLAVHLDLGMLWIFWPMIVTPSGRGADWWRSAARRSRDRVLGAALAMKARVERLRRRVRSAPPILPAVITPNSTPWLGSLAFITLGTIFLSFLIAVLPGEALEKWIVQTIPASWIVKERRCPDGCWVVTHLAFDDRRSPFSRNLRLPNAVITASEVTPAALATLRSRPDPMDLGPPDFSFAERKKIIDSIQGLDLTNRDLRFADLRGSMLIKADLRGSNFAGADLRDADFSGADLSPYDTREGEGCLGPQMSPPVLLGYGEKIESPACRTILWKVNLSKSFLPWAHLEHADIRQTDLSYAVLENAHLNYAYLDDSKLWDVEAYRADLSNALLRRADLTQSNFRFSDLSAAALGGANLERIDLTGASLFTTYFDGAYLRYAQMLVVRGNNAHFRGADLRFADLSASDFSKADFSCADFRGVVISSTNFYEARLSWVDARQLRREMRTNLDREQVGEEHDFDRVSDLIARFGTPSTIEKAIEREGALCLDREEEDCYSEDRLRAYSTGTAAVLARLVCEDSEMALSIARRISTGSSSYRTDDMLWTSIAEDTFAIALLDPKCKSPHTTDVFTHWVFQRVAQGLPIPPWALPRDIVFPRGVLVFESRGPSPIFRATHIWLTDDSVETVEKFYRSRARRGVWNIVAVPLGSRYQGGFNVYNNSRPTHKFATILIAPAHELNHQTKITFHFHDFHMDSEVPSDR